MTIIYKNTCKEDLLNLLTELVENVNLDDMIFQLKTKIEATEIFKENLHRFIKFDHRR